MKLLKLAMILTFVADFSLSYAYQKDVQLRYADLYTDEDLILFKPNEIKYNSYNNLLYIVDSGNHQIVILDEDLHLVKKIGRYGQGPGELDSPGGISFYKNENILITDVNNRRIQILNSDGKQIKQMRIQVNMPFPQRFRIQCDSRDNIYLNLPNFGMPDNCSVITVFDSSYNTFGKIARLPKIKNNFAAGFKNNMVNYAHFIVDEKDNLFLGYSEKPVIEKYDKFFNLVYRIETSTIVEVSNHIKEWEKRKKESEESPMSFISKFLIVDMAFDDKCLFVLFYSKPFTRVYAFQKENGKNQKIYDLRENNTKKYSHIRLIEFRHKEYIYAIENDNYSVVRFKK